jgi:superfamily II RNA helicase
MKQVLESNDEDVLVYVAPTKALVNQIAAEVQARFSKSFKHAGRSVWGIHTRDYRINNPTGCQVLVTVPHILQIMLLAPSNAEKKNSWSNRIKRIIFDEVHCIGQADDGLVWEQLLLLAPCPIIALSATVGNPKDLNAWLASTQKALGHDLVMVKHEHRYSDLRKFLYLPPKHFTFDGLKDRETIAAPGLDESPGFAFVHPVASLINRSRGVPEDLSLEARDCLLFYNALAKYQTDEHKLSPSLHPSKVLPEVIRKADVLIWETQLKAVLQEWLQDPNSPFDKVLVELSQPALRTRVGDLSVSSSASGPEQIPRKVNPNDLESTTLPLLVELHQKEALPAILFNYDRTACETLARGVIRELKENEKVWKANSPAWKKKMSAWEEYKASQELLAKKAPVAKSKKKTKRGGDDDDEEERVSKTDLAREAASSDFSLLASFDPKTPLDGYHFADWKKLQASELAEYQKDLTRRGVLKWLIKALARGVGVHHAGMNRKYRQVVEMLFRKGFLRVVIATGTLALGINMPCKTVVFSGDSVFLTALNFRQAAGRAGRRGFDVLGNVVFQGISFDKVCRLLSSRLPDLNGHFPITTSLVLRLCTLLHDTKESAYATKAIHALLSQPRLYLGGEEAKMTVLHHLRFSLE